MDKEDCRSSKVSTNEDRSAKRWNPEFFKNRRRDGKISERPFVDSLRDLKIKVNLLDAFLRNSKFSGSSWEVEQVQKFFREKKSVPESKLWIDHRSKTASFSEPKSKWLTARELAGVLKQQRFESLSCESVSRHLTFVPYLTPNVIEALIKTATCNEVEALRPAVRQHIAGETLIRVLVPASGFSNYRLVLNIPYLVLEERASVQSEHASPLEDQTKVLWEDLTSLSLESSTGQPSHEYAIYESQTTVVIFGCDHSRWRGYAFGQVGHEDLGQEDTDDSNTDDSDTNDSDIEDSDSDDGINDHSDDDEEHFFDWKEDLFASGGCAPALDPEDLVWDPRTYFLRAAHIRLDVVTEAYEYLVKKIEAGAKEWIPLVPGNHESNQMALERITRITIVFQRLRKHFSQAIRAWSRFSNEGDIEYFTDLLDTYVAKESLSGITQSFEKIFDLEQRLTLMEMRCEASAKILGLRMTQENNRLSLESNRMNRRLTEINMTASGHSERAAESASRSTTAAEETSRATRVNIQLFVMTTALVIALQYFCSDRALFAFERTPQAFWISIGILMPSLAALSLTLHAIDHYKNVLVNWICKSVPPASSLV